MQLTNDLRALLCYPDFRRLFTVRLTSQLFDGVLQVALATYVLLSPERQPGAAAIAGVLAVLLLPFSALGPFCGVFLDRWSRRQILLWTNLTRSLLVIPIGLLIATGRDGPVFYVAVLAVLSANRFLLAALSAALPHVVPGDRLVLANSVSPTAGLLAVLVGFGAGGAYSALSEPVQPVTGASELPLLTMAMLGYLAAGLLALRMPRGLLGPDVHGPPAVRAGLRHVVAGLIAGGRHLVERRPAAYGLAVIGLHRFGYGITTVATILLFRNYFNAGTTSTDLDAAMGGLTTTVLLSGVGFGAAAILTPIVVARAGKRRWILVLLSLAAAVQIFPGLLYTQAAVFIAASALGLASQGIKICVDTLVQEQVDDAFRGRVFALYDVLFNVVFVAAAAFAAATLPETGKSYPVALLVAVGYLLAAAAYSRSGDDRRSGPTGTGPVIMYAEHAERSATRAR